MHTADIRGVVEDQRAARRRHAAGKAGAEGYLDLTETVRVQAAGRRRAQHATFRVEEQDGDRFDLQRLADAVERCFEEGIERQVRQRGVGDRLQAAEPLRGALGLRPRRLLTQQEAGTLGFRDLAVGDVADDAGHQHALRGFDGAEADLGRELASVTPPAEELQADTHRACARGVGIGGPVRPVCFPEALGQQHLDRLAE